MSLFRQGWKAEVYFGSEITAHHMNTRSVYRFKENDNVSITHFAKNSFALALVVGPGLGRE